MVAYFKSLDENAMYNRYRIKRDLEDSGSDEVDESLDALGLPSEVISELTLTSGVKERVRRSPAPAKKKKKKNSGRSSRGRSRKTSSNLHQDFMGSDQSIFQDFYGGRYKNRHCQKRQFRVSFRDLGWQVRAKKPSMFECYKL